MWILEFSPVGKRGYFYDMDPSHMDHISQHRVDIASGFITGIRQHEHNLLFNMHVHHKVLRTDTALQFLSKRLLEYKARHRVGNMGAFIDMMKMELVGQTVITRYNNKTYRIDDIDFKKNPNSIWNEELNETYAGYYSRKLEMTIKDLKQPLLVSQPKVVFIVFFFPPVVLILFIYFLMILQTKDRRRGDASMIYLIPEVCHLTGLTDQMRSNFRVMQDLAAITRLNPTQRYTTMRKLLARLKENPQVGEELANYNVSIPFFQFCRSSEIKLYTYCLYFVFC